MKARYRYCTGTVYLEGEERCPQFRGLKKYINYRGPYLVWEYSCPEAAKAIELTWEVY